MDTIKDRDEATTWQQEHDVHAPKRGDEAPDFELRDSVGEHPVRLSNLLGEKPVALVFGSFT
jgi:hypothetical protein